MTAPPEVTAKNLSGKWTLNKSLSDSTEASLALQGVGWITRKALANAGVSLTVSHYADDAGVIHFDNEQQTLGRTADNKATLDGKAAEVDHPLYGKISVAHFWTPVSDLKEEYLKEGLEDGTEAVVEMLVESKEHEWTSRQVVGIENVAGGSRHQTRRLVVTKGNKVVKLRVVYDWVEN